MSIEPGVGPINILLYGPPAAGKLTVARALSRRYGLKVLDNHASTDPALRLFSFEQQEQLHSLVERLRVELLSTAAEAGLSVVSTLVFADPEDRAHVGHLVAAFASRGGHTGFVRLLPSRETLEQRVTEDARTRSEKISDVAQLRRLMIRWEVTNKINVEDLAIDNTDISADEVAETIARHFQLAVPAS
jgi:shikimate kinase